MFDDYPTMDFLARIAMLVGIWTAVLGILAIVLSIFTSILADNIAVIIDKIKRGR